MKYFKDKSAEQIFTLCLLVSCVIVMLFCAIVRLCGGLWFTADLDSVPVPSEFWQQFIKACLLVFELSFTYKILCRTKWIICVVVGVLQTIAIAFIPNLNNTIINIINLFLYFAIPLCFVRQWQAIVDRRICWQQKRRRHRRLVFSSLNCNRHSAAWCAIPCRRPITPAIRLTTVAVAVAATFNADRAA